MAAQTAALSLRMPLAKDAIRPAAAAAIHGSSSATSFLTDHGLEPFDQGARIDERRHARLDCSDGDGIRFAEMIACRGHQSRDCSRGRYFLKLLIGRLLCSLPPCPPFADDTQGTLEALHLQTAPELCPVTTARGPLRV